MKVHIHHRPSIETHFFAIHISGSMNIRVHIIGPVHSSELILRMKDRQGRISESTLSRHFNIPIGGISLLQTLNGEEDVSIEVPKEIIDGTTFFSIDVAFGDRFFVENNLNVNSSRIAYHYEKVVDMNIAK